MTVFPRILLFYFTLCALFFSFHVCAQATLDTIPGAIKEGHFTEAEKFLLEFIQKSPDEHRALFYLSQIYFKQDNQDKAIYWLNRAIDLNASDSEYFFWRGRCYLEKLHQSPLHKKYRISKEVISDLETAIEMNPEYIRARIYLGEFYFTAPKIAGGSRSKAEKQLALIRQCDPIKGRLIAAKFYLREDHEKLALKELEELVSMNPDIAETYWLMGKCHLQSGQKAEAEKAFMKAVSLDSDNSVFQKSLAQLRK